MIIREFPRGHPVFPLIFGGRVVSFFPVFVKS
jgi:hypothetical protein